MTVCKSNNQDELGPEPQNIVTKQKKPPSLAQTVSQLHTAAKSGQASIVTTLLKEGLDPDSLNLVSILFFFE